MQEVVKNYHRSEGNPRCTIKADLMKAYDLVDRVFLLQCISSFGFPVKFISWIRECISTSKFSIAPNGTLVGYFEGRNCLRQGDPISPYLFVIVVEEFSRLIEEVALGLEFQYHLKCAAAKLTHLRFADDVLLFSKATFQLVEKINKVLLEFADLSGLRANPSKSTLFCSGVSLRSN